MSTTDFVFTMRLAGRNLDSMLGDVADTVFHHLGLSPSDATGLTAQLKALIEAHPPGERELEVQFTARAGSCDVVVSAGTLNIWHETIVTSALP